MLLGSTSNKFGDLNILMKSLIRKEILQEAMSLQRKADLAIFPWKKKNIGNVYLGIPVKLDPSKQLKDRFKKPCSFSNVTKVDNSLYF